MKSNLLERPVTGSAVSSLLPVSPRPAMARAWNFSASVTTPYWARFNAKWFLGSCPDFPAELVTNACTAAARLPAATLIGLPMRLFPDRLLIEVIDSSPEPPAPRTAADPIAEDGRGLTLVSALSSEWGYFRHHDQKIIYSLLSRQTQPATF